MFGITNPLAIKALEYLIVIAVVFGAFYYVYQRGFDACDAEWTSKQNKANAELQAKYDALSSKYEDKKAERIVQTNTITKIVPQIVERTVYQTQCIDSQGLEIANKAIRGESYEAAK